MAKTLIDLDEGLLAEATVALGTSTKRETVTEALRRVIEEARASRLTALAELRAIADQGGFDFDRLPELDE